MIYLLSEDISFSVREACSCSIAPLAAGVLVIGFNITKLYGSMNIEVLPLLPSQDIIYLLETVHTISI
jgi:hypothetical protein